MRKIIHFPIDKLKPEKTAVLKSQGIDLSYNPSSRITNLFGSAQEMFFKLAEPKGVFSEIPTSEFEVIYYIRIPRYVLIIHIQGIESKNQYIAD